VLKSKHYAFSSHKKIKVELDLEDVILVLWCLSLLIFYIMIEQQRVERRVKMFEGGEIFLIHMGMGEKVTREEF
jgi:hypothetical protein